MSTSPVVITLADQVRAGMNTDHASFSDEGSQNVVDVRVFYGLRARLLRGCRHARRLHLLRWLRLTYLLRARHTRHAGHLRQSWLTVCRRLLAIRWRLWRLRLTVGGRLTGLLAVGRRLSGLSRAIGKLIV